MTRLVRLAFPLLLAQTAISQNIVSINSTASHAIPSTLYGLMYEDISHSGDGGLYAEMLQNRAFQQVTPGTSDALYAWAPISNASISVIADPSPVSSALLNSLQLSVPMGASGAVGFGNTGYFGININSSWSYNASFYYKVANESDFNGTFTIALQGADGTIYANATAPISGTQTSWTQINATLQPSSSPTDTVNNFTVTIDNAGGAVVNFAMFSLMPPMFMGRSNGMRVDIAETLAAIKPGFWRFPGGNNLEGQSVTTRWQWNQTVGSLLDRPGRVGDWGYINTDGIGLYEYLQWCEDVDMQPIMAVWAGYDLGGDSVAADDLAPYIQQAADQINFVIADASSNSAAAIRASMGHPDPFTLNFVEVGNEDFIAAATYPYRWQEFVGNLSALFPNITFIATSDVSGPALTPTPQAYDVHVYDTPDWFIDNAFYYDTFERNGTLYFEGEYAAISTNASNVFGTPDEGRFLFPEMQGSIAEAAFMTGLERNSDIVFAASYAPLLGNVVSNQWTPNLVNFDAEAVYPSTSYYVQQMFSLNKGDSYLPSTLPTQNGTLFWSATSSKISQQVMIKVANTANTSADITFVMNNFSTIATTGNALVLSGDATTSNDPTTPNVAVPQSSGLTVGPTFNWSAPALSFSVLTFGAH